MYRLIFLVILVILFIVDFVVVREDMVDVVKWNGMLSDVVG